MLVTEQKQSTITRPSTMPEQMAKSFFSVAVLVHALGYFVDIYGLFLFSNVRVESLRLLNLTDTQLLTRGEAIIQWQMCANYKHLNGNNLI